MHQRTQFTSTILLLAATVLGGCNFDESPLTPSTEGELGVVAFAYTGWDCLLGCALEQPLLVGTGKTISIVSDAGHGAEISARSSDPAVATFTRLRECDERTDTCTNSFAVETLAVGDVHLELVGPGGALVDRVKIEVRSAAAASLTLRDDDDEVLDPVDGRYFDLKVGDSVQIDAEFRDPDGRTLLYPDSGVQWQTSAASVAKLQSTWYHGSSGRSIMVEGNAPGAATLTVTAPGVSETVTIRVK